MNAKVNQKRQRHHRLKKKKDTGQKYYQEVLERYAKYDTALRNDDKTGLFAELRFIFLSLFYDHPFVTEEGGNFNRFVMSQLNILQGISFLQPF